MELQEVEAHQGLSNPLNKEILSLLTDMCNAKWEGTHTCESDEDIVECRFCELSALWYQLAAKAIQFVAPADELEIPEKDLPKIEDVKHRAFNDKSKGNLIISIYNI